MVLWNKSQWFEASVRLISELWQRWTDQWENKDFLIRFDGTTVWWMRTTVSIHVVMLSAVIQLYFLETWTQQQHLLHINSNTWSQQASGWSDWLTVLSLCVSPFSSHSFTEETHHNNTAETSMDRLRLSTDPRVSSLQCGLSTRSDSSFTSESFRLVEVSDPALSDGRGWTSELRPENHSWSLTNCSPTIWIKNKWWR